MRPKAPGMPLRLKKLEAQGRCLRRRTEKGRRFCWPQDWATESAGLWEAAKGFSPEPDRAVFPSRTTALARPGGPRLGV